MTKPDVGKVTIGSLDKEALLQFVERVEVLTDAIRRMLAAQRNGTAPAKKAKADE